MVTNSVSEKETIDGSLLNEKTLEFGNELNIKGFQASEGWLKNEKMYLDLVIFNLSLLYHVKLFF